MGLRVTKAIERKQEKAEKTLPKEWKWVELEDVCEIVGGNTLPSPKDAPVEDRVYCLKVSDLDGSSSNGRVLSGGLLYTHRTLAGNRVLSPGALVFPKRGGAIATNKKRILNVYAILDPNLMGVEVKSPILLSSFLHLWFESWDLSSLQSGNTVPQINRHDLAPLQIPLPPLAEQERIVTILNEQMAAVEKARAATLAQIEAAKALPAAYLRQAFDSPEAQKWERVSLSIVCTVHPGQHILEKDYNRQKLGVGYLTGPADFGKLHAKITKWTEQPKAWSEPGDVLVTVKGAGVGKANLAPDEKVAIGRQLMAVRPKPGGIEQFFLYYVLKTCFSQLQSEALGSTVPGLGREDIENLAIPLPSPSEQERIVTILNKQITEIEKIRQSLQVQLDAINKLPAAILRQAFNGEL